MSDVTALEKQKRDYQDDIRLHQAAERLTANPDFQELILRKFCVEHTADLVGASINLRINAEDREVSKTLATAGPALKEFLFVIEAKGEHALRQIPNVDDEIVVAREEEREA